MALINTFFIAALLSQLISPAALAQANNKFEAGETETMNKKFTNKLAGETSPYLLQHAHNPVDWYPWSKQAFDRARKEDKPIFLSIGYSTCHWCHVMERESFDNEQIAKIMNKHFISIKVDREERPDIDDIYMKAVQTMTGGGGWPLSVFLTPDGKPFYGGTYFPPKAVFGRPGFDQVLLSIADAWKNRRRELIDSAGKLSKFLSSQDMQTEKKTISSKMLKHTFDYFRNTFDAANGGFGNAPKFPQPSSLSMLLAYWYKTGDERALSMVETTLDAMAKGGIYDHIGGGFHRYSTDAKWRVPHFEKMLYDQALLARSYLQAYQVTGKEKYANITREIFDYVLRDMKDSNGGFYSAEDADSEGKEGTFYIWDLKEINQLLGKDSSRIFNEYYGVTERGNFEHGKNILYVTKSIEELAKKFEIKHKKAANILKAGRAKLFETRTKRVRPHRDEKIIAAWNGLMISSFALGGAILEDQKYISAAERSAEFILNTLRKNGRLMRYYAKNQVVELGFLNDYAFMIMAQLDLYEATFDAKWLVEAKSLSEQMIELFANSDDGGFYLTGSDGERLIIRSKPGYDGAVPSGNSVAAFVLLRLGQLTMQPKFTEQGEKVLGAFSQQLDEYGAGLTEMMITVDFWLGPRQEIVIVGSRRQANTKKMLKLVRSKFLPNAVFLFHETGEAGKPIEKIVPFLQAQVAIDGKATAYVCENYVCKQPVNDLRAFEDLLSNIIRDRKDN